MFREPKTLIAVTRYGMLADADERVDLMQPTMSVQIQRLEEPLGSQLFDRTGHSATLNTVGCGTLALVEHIVTLHVRLSDQADDNEQRGLVHIGTIASMQTSFLVDALVQFRRKFPRRRARTVPGVSLDLLGLVDAGEIDPAVLIRPPFAIPADLEQHTLVTEPFVLLVPANVPGNDWRALFAHQPSIRYDRRSFGGRRIDQLLCDQRITPYDVIGLDEL